MDLLVDAFIELKKSDKHEELRLIAGALPEKTTYLNSKKPNFPGWTDDFKIKTIFPPEKIRF